MSEPVIAKAGAPERVDFKPAAAAPAAEPAAAAPAPAAAAEPAAAAPAAAVDLTEGQIKDFFQKQGIEFTSIDEVKAKLSPAAHIPSEEEKAAANAAIEKRMVDTYLSTGGTVEQYAAMKSIAAMDAKTLAKESTIKELLEAGFDDKEIDEMIRERYYQIDLNELKQDEDNETEEDFKKRKALIEKKAAFGSKKLDNRSLNIKTSAESFLQELRDKVKEEDLQKQKEATFLSNVDESLKKFPRKLTFELGEVDNQKIDPVSIDVTESNIEKVQAILKDPAKRKQYFFNEDSPLEQAISVILKNEALESMIKASFLEGGTRQVNQFKSIFPDNAYALGVGGAPQKGQQGKIAKAGPPERVRQNN